MALVVSLMVSPLLLAAAFRPLPAVVDRRHAARAHVRPRRQTAQHRLERTLRARWSPARWTPTGFARYADRWVDFLNGLVIAAVTAVVAQSLPAGGVLSR